MPRSNRRPRRQSDQLARRPFANWPFAIWHFGTWQFGSACCSLAALAALALFFPGCRILRSRKTSEENIAAARQLSLQGLDAQQRGQWERAEMLFAAAITKCPSDERARSGHAEALWQRGDYSGAISNLEDVARLSGNDPACLVRLGSMYLHQGNRSRALALAERAIGSNGQLASAWALRGQVLLAAGSLDESLACFHRALSIDAAQPEVQLAIADIYHQQGRPQRALATLQNFADRFPEQQLPSPLLYREGLALRELDRSHDAIRVLQQAVQQGPATANVLFALAEAQATVGELAAARQTLFLALTIEPGNRSCADLLANLNTNPILTASAQNQ